MQLSTRIVEARWDEKAGKWRLRLQRIKTGEEFEDSADVIYRCIGGLNDWKWPDIPGLHSFKGKLVHSATWDTTYDYRGQNVAVIGNGSSGIQIVPTIQPQVERLDHYVRGRTWISSTFVNEEVERRGEGSNFNYTEEEKAKWAKDPEAYLKYRKQIEHELQGIHSVTHKDSELATDAKVAFRDLMKKRLSKKSHFGDILIPEFSPGCRRLTPGPGYLEALTEDNVHLISTSIQSVNETGIRTSDGQQRDVDLIVCATGFDTSNRNRFPIYGESSLQLKDRWEEYPEPYKTMAVDGFPNMFMCNRPNCAVGSGNLLILFEGLVEYAAKALAKMQSENIRSMQPSRQSVKNFSNFCDAYFANTVFAEDCASWYKAGKSNGRVSALWPGSSIQAMQAFKNPRWEDWEYTYVDGNPWSWFGDGWSIMDRDLSLDRTYYLGYDPKMVHEDLETTMDDSKKKVLNAIEGKIMAELVKGDPPRQPTKHNHTKRKAGEELSDRNRKQR